MAKLPKGGKAITNEAYRDKSPCISQIRHIAEKVKNGEDKKDGEVGEVGEDKEDKEEVEVKVERVMKVMTMDDFTTAFSKCEMRWDWV